MSKKYHSPIMASIHETVRDLHKMELIDKQVMQEFDKLCLSFNVLKKRKADNKTSCGKDI